MKKDMSPLEYALKDPGFITKYKTGDKMSVVLGGEEKEIDIYSIPVTNNLIYYNPENARINTALSQYKEEQQIDTPDPAAMGIDKYNRLFDSFIRNQNAKEYASIRESIKRFSQSAPGICLADGRILSGNCRFAALRELQTKTGEELFFKAGIITDADYTCDSKEIKLLELYAQNSMHVHSGYDVFNRVCDIAQTIFVKKVCTKEEYQATYLQSETKDFLAEYSVAELLVDLCDFAGIDTGRMYLLEKFQVSAQLHECSRLLKKIPESQQDRIKEYMFSEILLYREENTDQRARNDTKLLTGLDRAQREKMLEEHRRQIVAPVKEGIQKVLDSSDHLDSSAKLKNALETELATNIQDGKTLKVRGGEFAKNWNEELASKQTSLYPINTTQTALRNLNRVNSAEFMRLSDLQKVELSNALVELQRTVHALLAALEKVK